MGRGKGTLGPLGLAPQFLQSSVVLLDIHLVLPLDQLDEVVHDSVIEIFSSQVCVSACGDDLYMNDCLRTRRHAARNEIALSRLRR